MTTLAPLPSWSRIPVRLLLVACVSAVPSASLAQSLGPEVQVNVWTWNDQWGPSVGAVPNGEFVVAWSSYAQFSGCYGYQLSYCHSVHSRRVSAAGEPIDGEIEVSSSTSDTTEKSPAVARDADGDFVVAWDSDVFLFGPGRVSARVFDAEGTAQMPPFQVDPVTGSQRGAAVDLAADGEFVVVWQHESPNLMEKGIYGRRFDAAGQPLGDAFAVRPASQAGGPGAPTVAMSGAGAFVVAWVDGRVSARRYDETGQPLGDSFVVNGPDVASSPAIAMNGSGGFVIAWTRRISDQWDIAARRYDAEGLPLGPEFLVNTYTTGLQSGPAVGVDGAGRFLVVWLSDSQDGSGFGIHGQAFDADEARIGTEFRVNAWTTGNQQRPAVVAAGPGHFLVAWDSQGQDGSFAGVFSRVVDLPQFADGFELGDTCAWSGTVGDGCL